MSFEFGRRERERLLSWYKGNANQPLIEIEARIKDVSALGFDTVLRNLRSSKTWSSTAEEDTLDLQHASGVRETRDKKTGGTSFLRKERHDAMLADCGTSEYQVRFSVASENEIAHDTSEVSLWRYKRRHKFVYKQMFAFDLTVARQGETQERAKQAEPQYEIEIEFCGQTLEVAAQHSYLTDSMLMKVSDLVKQLVRASEAPLARPSGAGGGGGGGPEKRQRTQGPLEPGERVTLQDGTDVTLAPAGQNAGPPLGGEMPFEMATQIDWVFSHVEEGDGDGGAQRAHLMNLPCGIDGRRYPLYYLCGSVERTRVSRKAAGPPAGQHGGGGGGGRG